MYIFIPGLMTLVTSLALAESPGLTFEPAGNETYTFNTGVLRGTLRSEGRSIGLLSIEHVPTGTRLDGNDYGLFSHYRVFTANKRYGHGAWDWPSTSNRLPDGAVEVHWPAADDRPFEMSAVYRWSAPDTLDLTTSVTAREDLKAFESFLASYFTEAFPASTVYVKNGPEGQSTFLAAEQEAGVWQSFSRDREAAGIIQDGRWTIEPNPVDWVLRNDFVTPLGIRRNKENGLCAILMAPPEDCFAVMTPYAGENHRSLYLSLFGRDVKAGETVAARSRLVVRVLPEDKDAVALCRSYLAAPSEAKRAINPLFALCMDTHDANQRTLEQQAGLLRELGYDGAGHLWLDNLAERIKTLDAAGLKLFQVYLRANVAPGSEPYDPRLKDSLPLLKGRDTQLALLMSGLPPSDTAGDARAVEIVREIADLAAAAGVRVALYPHSGDWLERVEDALRITEKADRPNVGVMFNLCHWLKVDDERNLKPLLTKAMPILFAVSIHGADTAEEMHTQKGNWIQPLDSGSFDILSLLKTLRDLGYKGPVGLQCYGIPGDARDHLSRSIVAWRNFQEQLASEAPAEGSTP